MCKTDYGGGGGNNVPKIDYVICGRPHIKLYWILTGDTRKIFVSNIQDRRRVSLGARLDRL